MDVEYFQNIKDSSNLKDSKMPFFVPHTLVYYDELPPTWDKFVDHFCSKFSKDGKDDTVVILRFFEYDEEDETYTPVHVGVKDGKLVQHSVVEHGEEE